MSSSLLGHQLYGDPVSPERPVVLLLNGGMMTHPSWAALVEPLTRRYSVLGCDFRGQLLSPGSSHPRIEDNVDDVVALLDHLDLGRVHVLGASFGGMVSLPLTARHPDRVESLAIVTSVHRTPPGMREGSREVQRLVRGILDGDAPDAFNAHMLDDLYSDDYRAQNEAEIRQRQERTAALPTPWFEGLFGILQAIEDFDLSPYLEAIRCPTWVAHASNDIVMPTEQVLAFAKALPGSELAIHPTSGHALVLEDPEWLVRHYLDFLERRSPS